MLQAVAPHLARACLNDIANRVLQLMSDLDDITAKYALSPTPNFTTLNPCCFSFADTQPCSRPPTPKPSTSAAAPRACVTSSCV